MKFRMVPLSESTKKNLQDAAEQFIGRVDVPEEPVTGMAPPQDLRLNRMELPTPGAPPAVQTGMPMAQKLEMDPGLDQATGMPPLSPLQKAFREKAQTAGYQRSVPRSQAMEMQEAAAKELAEQQRTETAAQGRADVATAQAAGRVEQEKTRQAGQEKIWGGRNKTKEQVTRIMGQTSRYGADQSLAGRKYAADKGLEGTQIRADTALEVAGGREAMALLQDDTKRDLAEAQHQHDLVVEKLKQAGKSLDRESKEAMFNQSIQAKYAAFEMKAQELEQQQRFEEARALRQLAEAQVQNDTRIFNALLQTPQGMKQTPEEQAAGVAGQRAGNAAKLAGARPSLAKPITRPTPPAPVRAPAAAPAKLSSRIQAKMAELGPTHPRYAELEAAYKNAVATGR